MEDGDVQKLNDVSENLNFPEFGHELKKSLDSYLKIQEEILDWENSIEKARPYHGRRQMRSTYRGR